ncbi:hypothetical protein [Rhodococcus sp. USK13]|nr:hypothetical protein [Rhodococcus sp. USK13]
MSDIDYRDVRLRQGTNTRTRTLLDAVVGKTPNGGVRSLFETRLSKCDA